MTVRMGEHFLQIPGPANVPDRVLRAMETPTIDHHGARGPGRRQGRLSRGGDRGAIGANGAKPDEISGRLAGDHQHRIMAVMVVHNETSTGVTRRIPEIRRAIDRAKHPDEPVLLGLARDQPAEQERFVALSVDNTE